MHEIWCACSLSTENIPRLPFDLGDVVHLDVAGQPMIVLGSQEAASELLEKRSSNYSDRAPSPMVDMYAPLRFAISSP